MNERQQTSSEHSGHRRLNSTARPRPGTPVRGYYLHRGYSDKQLETIGAYMSAMSEFGVLFEAVSRETKVNVYSDGDVRIFEEEYGHIIDATYIY